MYTVHDESRFINSISLTTRAKRTTNEEYPENQPGNLFNVDIIARTIHLGIYTYNSWFVDAWIEFLTFSDNWREFSKIGEITIEPSPNYRLQTGRV